MTLDDGNDWADHRALLDYGFSLYGEVSLMGKMSYEVPVCGGTASSVRVCTKESPTAMLPQGHGEIVSVVEMPRFLYAGVCEGDVVGKVVFYADGARIGEAFLYAEGSVPIERKKNFFQKIFFNNSFLRVN